MNGKELWDSLNEDERNFIRSNTEAQTGKKFADDEWNAKMAGLTPVEVTNLSGVIETLRQTGALRVLSKRGAPDAKSAGKALSDAMKAANDDAAVDDPTEKLARRAVQIAMGPDTDLGKVVKGAKDLIEDKEIGGEVGALKNAAFALWQSNVKTQLDNIEAYAKGQFVMTRAIFRAIKLDTIVMRSGMPVKITDDQIRRRVEERLRELGCIE